MPDTATSPQMSLEWLDPTAITGGNVREAVPSQQLIDSIREIGLLQPIGVLRTPDGELVLRFGRRRLRAHIKLGKIVPAYVLYGTNDGTPDEEIQRILMQLDENENREPLTAADRANAVATLFDLGADVALVRRRTGYAKDELDAARKVATSKAARTAAADPALDLTQAAAIADFDDDEGIVRELVDAAHEGKTRFAHALEKHLDDRADRQAMEAHAAKLEKRGITVVAERPGWENIISSWAGENGIQLTEKNHGKCPGNVVHLVVHYGRNIHETWFCTDPKAYGHQKYRAGGGATGQSTEEASAERRKVLAGNKAWRSAEKVRRAWLREFLTRPKVPDGGLLFTLEAFALSSHRLRIAMEHRSEGQHAMARELLGLPKGEGSGWNRPPEVYTAMTKASPQRAQVIALAIVLGAIEAATDVQSWRKPGDETAEYLEALSGWGYELSDIEAELVATVRERTSAAAADEEKGQADVPVD